MRKTCPTSKCAANKQAKKQRNSKGAPTDQPQAQEHAQPASVRPIYKENGRETLKQRLPSNQKCKYMHNRQACGQ